MTDLQYPEYETKRSARSTPAHEITERRSPLYRMAFCSCGWRGQVSRGPNALGQASKLRGQINAHLKTAGIGPP